MRSIGIIDFTLMSFDEIVVHCPEESAENLFYGHNPRMGTHINTRKDFQFTFESLQVWPNQSVRDVELIRVVEFARNNDWVCVMGQTNMPRVYRYALDGGFTSKLAWLPNERNTRLNLDFEEKVDEKLNWLMYTV